MAGGNSYLIYLFVNDALNPFDKNKMLKLFVVLL